MDNYSIWGTEPKKKKKKSNTASPGLNNASLGLISLSQFASAKPARSTTPSFNMGLGAGQQKEPASRDERRTFSQSQRKEILYQQNNKCAECHKALDPRAIEYDHKKPWAAGGRTLTQNGRALCANCHKIVTHKSKLKETDKKRKKPTESNPFAFKSPFDM